MGTWTLYFDGACEPCNPGGHATYGWCLYSPDNILCETGNGHVISGEGSTNNVAEFAALKFALLAFINTGHRGRLLCRGDSKLVVMIVLKKWRCKKPHLRVYRREVHSLLDKIDDWHIEWIPREENSSADELSKTVIIPQHGIDCYRYYKHCLGQQNNKRNSKPRCNTTNQRKRKGFYNDSR